MIGLKSFDYYLPKELIAFYPAKERRSSRLLVLDRCKKSIQHRKFTDLIDFLNPQDALVLNNTYVIPARLNAIREKTGAKLEILLIKKIEPFKYRVLIKPSKRARVDDIIILAKSGLKARVIEDNPPEKVLEFESHKKIDKLLEEEGNIPLPPYIKRLPEAEDKIRYQTVFAEDKGAVAAPTAGLHFDKEYLKLLNSKGVNICYLTLHISYGTFKPITEDDLDKGRLYPEYYRIKKEIALSLNKTRLESGKIVAVGTTSCRALESGLPGKPEIEAAEKETDLFIYPPYKFKFTDSLLTNFHLPKSSLLMLVSAFCGDVENLGVEEGHALLMKAYKEAVEEKYRFYSYGDAMLVL